MSISRRCHSTQQTSANVTGIRRERNSGIKIISLWNTCVVAVSMSYRIEKKMKFFVYPKLWDSIFGILANKRYDWNVSSNGLNIYVKRTINHRKNERKNIKIQNYSRQRWLQCCCFLQKCEFWFRFYTMHASVYAMDIFYCNLRWHYGENESGFNRNSTNSKKSEIKIFLYLKSAERRTIIAR